MYIEVTFEVLVISEVCCGQRLLAAHFWATKEPSQAFIGVGYKKRPGRAESMRVDFPFIGLTQCDDSKMTRCVTT